MKTVLQGTWVVLLLTAAGAVVAEEISYASLTEQLEGYSRAFGVTISGLEKTSGAPAVSLRMESASAVKRLLAGYNYLMVESDDGGVERVIILDRLEALPDRIVLQTEKVGNRHTIPVMVTGADRQRSEVRLMIDTGADLVILPESMIELLGLVDDSLETRQMQTANGLADAKVGKLPALQIGDEIIDNVDVAFVPDELLGDVKLIGMGVLSRFRMTLDDAQRRITLIKR